MDSGFEGLVLRDSCGRMVRSPDEETVQSVVQTLTRGEHVVISAGVEGGGESTLVYAQVWLRPEGIYQVEYRDGAPSRHWRAMSVSREKAAGFLASWCANDPDYARGFQWEDISAWFAATE
jgi:hypothetical protein